MVNRFPKMNIRYGMLMATTAVAAIATAGVGLTGCLKRQKNNGTSKEVGKDNWLRNRWHDMLNLMGCGYRNQGGGDQTDSDQQVPDYLVMQQRSLDKIQGTACNIGSDIEMTEFKCSAEKQASDYAEELKKNSLIKDANLAFDHMLFYKNNSDTKEYYEKEFMRSLLILSHYERGDNIRPQTYQQKYDFFTRGFLRLIGQDVIDLHQENIDYSRLKTYFDRCIFNNFDLDAQKFSSDQDYFKACLQQVQQASSAI